MSSFVSPKLIFKIASSYLADINRLWNFDEEQLKRFQTKRFKEMVSYAYQVPLYHEKYKKAGVKPNDINSIDDITKLPFITKDDIRSHFPDKITPRSFDCDSGFLLSTSGSTGKPMFMYVDRFSAIKSLIAFARILKAYGGSWRTSRVAQIIDVEPGSAENAFFVDSAVPILNRFISLDNIRYLHLGLDPAEIMDNLDRFKPEYIGTDPNMLRQLADLKNKGLGSNVNPKFLFSSGSMLDPYTKKYVEDVFDARILDVYGTTEGGPLGFECLEGDYHLNSDFIYMEILDDEDVAVDFNCAGHSVITKLYGQGTPIIRYKGIDDILIPIKNETSCGITSQMIKQIEGRASELIYLSDGSTLSPLAVTGIPAKTMEKFCSFEIKQFQIIQHSIDDIEILVVLGSIDKTKKQLIIDELSKKFQDKIGPLARVRISEVDLIQKDSRSDKIKVIVSKLK